MSKKLNDLSPEMRPLAVELIALAVEDGLEPIIVETRRSLEQQQLNVSNGVSQTLHSKHLTGDAIDIVPKKVTMYPRWKPDSELWERLGALGESLGLVWGGRWTMRDCPHFERKL